jgi:hypothetical protein
MTAPADTETKPSYDELVARLHEAENKLASAPKGRSPIFTKSAKNPNYFVFTHNLGTKGVYPWVGTTKEVWLMILNNSDAIRAALK